MTVVSREARDTVSTHTRRPRTRDLVQLDGWLYRIAAEAVASIPGFWLGRDDGPVLCERFLLPLILAARLERKRRTAGPRVSRRLPPQAVADLAPPEPRREVCFQLRPASRVLCGARDENSDPFPTDCAHHGYDIF